MGKLKLTYFNGKGRAEAARLILAQAGVDYEDERIEFEDWPELKSTLTTPGAQLPILEVDGKVIGQSMAITRFLARKYNLAGKNEWEEAKADMIVDCIDDTFNGFVACLLEGKMKRNDEARQKMLIEEFVTKSLPAFLDMMKKQLEENGGQYLVGSDLTWADLVLQSALEMFVNGHGMMPEYQNPDALKNHESVADYKKKIENLPNLKAWIEKRPNTPF